MKSDEKETNIQKDLNSRELSFTYWGTMNYLVGLIKSSELKAGLILSFYGIIFNFVYQHIDDAKDSFSTFGIVHVLAVLWLASTLISMFYSVRSFIPRIEKKYEPNVFFFGDVISKFGTIEEYAKTFLETNINKKELYNQLGQQIYINSKITAAKFKNVNKSLKYLAISLILLLVFVINHILEVIF